jgi:hypothetical protein
MITDRLFPATDLANVADEGEIDFELRRDGSSWFIAAEDSLASIEADADVDEM